MSDDLGVDMTTLEDTFEARLPTTPAGAAARWLMDWTRRRGAGLTLDEVERMYHELPDDFDFDNYLGGCQWVDDQLGERFSVASMQADDPTAVHAILVAASGRRWEWSVTVTETAPHRITDQSMRRALPPGVEIRPARPSDAPALRDVARRAAVRLTDATIAIDPGDDYFAACRLMGETAITFVATHEGTPIGIHCGVSFPIRLQGTDGTCCLIAHSRLLPEFSGGGIWGRMNDHVFEHFQAQGGWQVPLGYVRPDNAAAQRLGGAEARWPTRPFRAVINCAATASRSGAGRAADPSDAGRIVELLNRFHAKEEFYVPSSEVGLTERLSRAPELYDFADIRLGERSVLGVWARGDQHTYAPDDGDATTTVRAVALDYGFEPGAEDEFTALLQAACRGLADQGITHLGVFSSPASPGSRLLSSLAETIEEYDLMPPGIPEPPTVAEHGVYVDPVYF